jgi:uncharacterized zinc-type alcohol dehydrogenase-like protein
MVEPIRAWSQAVAKGPLAEVVLPRRGPLGPHEIDVDVAWCSVCHSDLHLVDGDWNVARPLVPGHEIIGRVTARGAAVEIAEGSEVGIGWQAGSCGACHACTTGREHLCGAGKVRTCVGRPGGFASSVRCDARFAFALPPGLDAPCAAPLVCAGVTVFSPLERLSVGPGVRVGVVGLGGLGHIAVQIAKRMGARVVAFDPDLDKRDLALSLGAEDLVDARGALPVSSLDVVLVTTHVALAWDAWLRALDLGGTLCLVGIPPGPLQIDPDRLLDEEKRVTGSVIGSPAAMRRMLSFCAAGGVRPVVEHMPMSSVNEALARVREGRARMRIVLDA